MRMTSSLYVFLNCHRHLRLKKLIMSLCLIVIFVSIYILIEIHKKSFMTPDLVSKPMALIPIQEFELNSITPKDVLANLPEIMEKGGIDTIRTFDELSKVLPPDDIKKPYQIGDIPNHFVEDIGDQLEERASVTDIHEKTELIDLAISNPHHQIHFYSAADANHVVIPNSGLSHDNGVVDNNQKHLLILGHYEQLGKTTVNFFEAAKLAYLTDRKIVKPFARDSRFCGLTSGWTGSIRKGTRSFFPLDVYFNVSALEKLFHKHKFGDMEYLESFRRSCSYKNNRRHIIIVYFMYKPYETNQRVMSVSQDELKEIELLLSQSPGWIDCSFINKRIRIDKRIGDNIKAGRQYCVDPNRIVDVSVFENKILRNDPCVVIHQWKGTGFERTHFNLSSDIAYEQFLRHVVPSDLVISELRRFTNILGPRFIGVHIRAERQLLWYGIRKYLRCMDMVLKEVKKVQKAQKIWHIFVSADVGPYGSDTIKPKLSDKDLKTAKEKFHWLVRKLNATTFSVLKPRHHVWTDNGLAAFTQLHILSLASHLVTLGSGTFQKWITDKFKRRKLSLNDKSWTITRTCFSESKNWRVNNPLRGKHKLQPK